MSLLGDARAGVHRIAARASAAGELPGAARLRRFIAILFAAYGTALIAATVAHGDLPKTGHVLVVLAAIALYANRGGRFIRDWLPPLLGLYAYTAAGAYVDRFKLGVHYMPQIDMEKFLFGGTLPTVWLQHHVYTGRTGPLEVLAAIAYASHFFVPLLFAYYLWWTGRRSAFTSLMFGLIAVLLMAEITFIFAPTAPPWMAAQHGLIPPVHDVLKNTLADMHLSKVAAFLGNPKNYNTVAAMPSLHAAWPLIGLLVAVRFRLPRWLRATLSVQWIVVLFSVVYTGEHYVSDALVGVAYGALAFALVTVAMRRRSSEAQGAITAEDDIRLRRPEGAGASLVNTEPLETIEA